MELESGTFFLQIENPRNLTYVYATIMGTNPPIDASRENWLYQRLVHSL